MTAQHIVAPADIENKLLEIWNKLSKQNKMRASLFNLIIYTKLTERVDYLRNVAQKVIEKFPCRIIFISADTKSKKKYLKTAVSVISPDNQSSIACDTIDIAIGGEIHDIATLIILPHLLPDLPIYLLWGEDPTEQNLLLDNLQKIAHKIIFDSEVASDLSSFAQILTSLKNIEVADLNWARLEIWRDLSIAYFRSREKFSYLLECNTLTLQYNAKPHPYFCHTKIKALYFQAWLASRLGWELKSVTQNKDDTLIHYNNKGQKLTVHLIPTTSSIFNAGDLILLDFAKASGEKIIFTRSTQNLREVKIETCVADNCEIPHFTLIEKSHPEQSLVKEIFHKNTSLHYLSMLDILIKSSSKVC